MFFFFHALEHDWILSYEVFFGALSCKPYNLPVTSCEGNGDVQTEDPESCSQQLIELRLSIDDGKDALLLLQ